MPNKNCLIGLACPDCGSTEPLYIVASAEFEVWDSGTTEFADPEWDDDSEIQCRKCGRDGTVKEFKVSEEKNE